MVTRRVGGLGGFDTYVSDMALQPRNLRAAALLLAAFALAATACSSGTEDATTGDAELAPDFVVPTAGGGSFSLDAHLASDGRPIFLNLWASWCFPCREEMPAIDQASKLNPQVAFIGVSVQDTIAEAQTFLDEVQVSYTIGFDEDNAVDNEYRPLGLPASYIISSDGEILERIFGKVTEEDLADKFAKHFG
jgi:thiol-disulfide isomerase/thioredoxin